MTPDQIANELARDIIFGRFLRGERLIEESLAARFSVKRHVIRAALVELERDGYVVRQRNRGAHVRCYSDKEAAEFDRWQAALHDLAMARLAWPVAVKSLELLREIQRAQLLANGNADLEAVFDLNNAFYDRIFSTCDNRFLTETIRRVAWTGHAVDAGCQPDKTSEAADIELNAMFGAQTARVQADIIDAIETQDRARLHKLCLRKIPVLLPNARSVIETAA